MSIMPSSISVVCMRLLLLTVLLSTVSMGASRRSLREITQVSAPGAIKSESPSIAPALQMEMAYEDVLAEAPSTGPLPDADVPPGPIDNSPEVVDESPSPVPEPSPDPVPEPSPEPVPEPSPEPVPEPPSPSPPPPPPPENSPQAQALQTFKAGIQNADKISEFNSWQDGKNECSWGGVRCNNQGVVENLDLSNLGMEGMISSSLADSSLSGLRSINLSRNKLGGSIPTSFNNAGALPNLQSLDLSSNQLVGGPADFGMQGCQKLESFNLESNLLGFFPKWSFSNLKILRVNNNNLNTFIPDYFAQTVRDGNAIVIMPQSGDNRVCGDLPPGPTWAEAQGGQLVQLNSLPSCNPVLPPPPASPPPPPPSPSVIPTPPSPVTPSNSPPVPVPSSSSSLSTGAIVGIAVGGAAALVLLILLLFFLCRPKRDRSGKIEDADNFKSIEPGNEYPLSDQRGQEINDLFLKGAIMHARSQSQSSIQKQQSIGSQNSVSLESGNLSPAHGRVPSSAAIGLDVKLWTVNFNDLQMERQIGEGSFGRVYLAKWNETLVAVKILLSMNSADEDSQLALSNPVLSSLAKESNMMAALRHPNVVSFLGVCLDPPCIVTEFCARGSLTDVLRGAKASPAKASMLDWSRRLNMALDAAKGMLYLHNHAPPIIHRDLKSPNLLVDKHWRVKVSDFNLSKLLDDSTVMSSMAATNPRWLAPEILGGNNATFASDVYSFAIVMWELMTWELPWGVTNPWQVVTLVMEGGRLSIPTRYDLPGPDTGTFEGLEDYVTLMKRCWSHIQEDRPCFQEIIAELRRILGDTLARNGKVSIKEDQRSDSMEKQSSATRDDSVSQSSGIARQSSEMQNEVDLNAAYNSTVAQTQSIQDPKSLNASWGTKLKSHSVADY